MCSTLYLPMLLLCYLIFQILTHLRLSKMPILAPLNFSSVCELHILNCDLHTCYLFCPSNMYLFQLHSYFCPSQKYDAQKGTASLLTEKSSGYPPQQAANQSISSRAILCSVWQSPQSRLEVLSTKVSQSVTRLYLWMCPLSNDLSVIVSSMLVFYVVSEHDQ